MNYQEYVIWGYPPNSDDTDPLNYDLLVVAPGGQAITELSEAERIAKLLTEKHGCTRVTIQCVSSDNPPNFAETVN